MGGIPQVHAAVGSDIAHHHKDIAAVGRSMLRIAGLFGQRGDYG